MWDNLRCVQPTEQLSGHNGCYVMFMRKLHYDLNSTFQMSFNMLFLMFKLLKLFCSKGVSFKKDF